MGDITSVTPILHEMWAPRFNKVFSEEVVALSRIERTSEGITSEVPAGFGTNSGRYVVIPIQTTRNPAVSSIDEWEAYPQPDSMGWASCKVRLRKQVAAGHISEEALDLVTGNPRSFANAFDREMEDTKAAALYDYARQVYGGVSNSLGTISSYVAGTGVATLDTTAYPYGNEHFYGHRGLTVDVVSADGVVKNVGAVEVTAISTTASTVTLSGTFGVTPAATDIIVRRGSYNRGLNGFNDMVKSTGTYQELAPASVPEWAALEYTVDGTYTDKHVIRFINQFRKLSGDTPSAFFTGTGVWTSIYDYLDGDRRFDNTVEFAHGVSGIPLNIKGRIVPIVDDPMYPENPNPTLGTTQGDLLGVCEDKIKLYREASGWQVVDKSGSMFINSQDRSGSWEFRLRQYSQIGTELRNAHGRINQITITA